MRPAVLAVAVAGALVPWAPALASLPAGRAKTFDLPAARAAPLGIASGPLASTGLRVNALPGTAFTEEVAAVSGSCVGSPQAAVDWGDGSATSTAATSPTGNGFTVSATHLFEHTGSFTGTVSGTAACPNGGSQAFTQSFTANVSEVPAVPRHVGCYSHQGDGWRRVKCETKAYIEAHVPHPEVLPGLVEESKPSNKSFHPAKPPFVLGMVSAAPIAGQTGSESDTNNGSAAFSLQDNVSFVGNNKQRDAVQFVDQERSVLGIQLNNVCVWQILDVAGPGGTVPTGNYAPVCGQYAGLEFSLIEGFAQGGVLIAVAATGSGSPAFAVVALDTFGLGASDRWNNNSGSILGYGMGSEAVFGDSEWVIAQQVSSCLSDGGMVRLLLGRCTGPKLKPHSHVDHFPGLSIAGTGTQETNNLIPVTGSPPFHLPTLSYLDDGYVAAADYGATTTGSCWTGAPPTCL